MKTCNRVKALIFLAFICFLLSCKKETLKHPDEYLVYDGNQVFGAYLNGQPWVADYRDVGYNIGPLDITMWWSSYNKYHYMTVSGQKDNEAISLYIPPPITTGRVQLNTSTYPHPWFLYPSAYGMYESYTPYKRYMTTNVVTGYIDILQCDTMKHTIEARFEFEAINSQTGEKVKITNGYFRKK
jgi:hypothetical protein